MAYTREDAKHLDFSDIVDPDEPLLDPVHPGDILLKEFLEPLGMSASHLAKSIGLPSRHIQDLIGKKNQITADTALRLEKFFGMRAQFWLNLQTAYDLEIAERALGSALDAIIPHPRPAQAAE